MKSSILIVSGGKVNTDLLSDVINSGEYDYIIGVDKGLESLDGIGVMPDMIIGDFDSAKEGTYNRYCNHPNLKKLNPMKDYSDTHMAFVEAMKLNPVRICVIGATGSRIDHMLANVSTLALSFDKDIDAFLLDTNNKIRLINNSYSICKKSQYGKYVSFIPFTDEVSGVFLEGFVYELNNYTMRKDDVIGISNEVREEEASVRIGNGVLIMIEAKD